MKKLKSYADFDSLTWWGSVLLIVMGVTGIAMPESFAVTELGKAISLVVSGDGYASPGQMIGTGLVGLGLRAKMERDRPDV